MPDIGTFDQTISTVLHGGLGLAIFAAIVAFAFAPTLVVISSKSVFWIVFVIVLNLMAIGQVVFAIVSSQNALISAIVGAFSTLLWFVTLIVAGLGTRSSASPPSPASR
jgi:hypothetical protein